MVRKLHTTSLKEPRKFVKEADEYYKVNADGFYARSGYLWSDCRLICKDGEYVLLDFYTCD